MATITGQLFDAPSADSGISIALGESRGKQFIRLGFMLRGQTEHFGRPFKEGEDFMALVIDDTKPHLVAFKLVGEEDPGAMPLKSGMKESFNLKVLPWCRVAKGVIKVVQIDVTGCDQERRIVTCRLPDWARPEPAKIGQGRSLLGD